MTAGVAGASVVSGPRPPHARLYPFFETEPDPAATTRLLLMSPHFPPDQAAGALRWEKLTGLAAARGWTVDVITIDPVTAIDPDFARLRNLARGLRVFGVPLHDLRVDLFVNRAWRWLRPVARAATPRGPSGQVHDSPSLTRGPILQAYFAWRDQAIHYDWARRASALALALARTTAYRCVVTCGPPHMVHEGGRRVSVATGLPLALDLRDPWSLVERLPFHIASPLWWRIARKYESRAMARASLVVMTSEAARQAMQVCYPAGAGHIIAVPNGFDDEEPRPPLERSNRFIVAYTGSIYLDRDPTMLFRAAALVIRELGLTPEQFGLEFMGGVEGVGARGTRDMARAEGIEAFVHLYPPQPREKALRFLASAAVLVCLHQDSALAIPGKLFEYMLFNAWVLALADPGSSTAQILEGTTADVVRDVDPGPIAAVLRRRYLQFVRGERPSRIVSDDQLSRRAQARRLFDAIAELPRPQ